MVLSLPKTNVGPLRYATDTFDRWQDNLRAIALGLEALRRVDRYGITRRGEQYQGFRALPPGATAMPATMTIDDAARLMLRLDGMNEVEVEDWLGVFLEQPSDRATVWRQLAKKHHPDAGGDRAVWDQLEQAKRVLDEHLGAA